jgi:predicted esterase
MPRFFRRLAEGVFDEGDVRRRAFELADFVQDARRRHCIDRPIALCYSNDANIATAVMLLRPGCSPARRFSGRWCRFRIRRILTSRECLC